VTIAQHNAAYIAHPQAVYQYVAFRHFINHPSPVWAKLQHLPALDHEYPLPRDTHLLCNPGVVDQVSVLPMDRHKEARPREAKHHLVLLSAGMARNMDRGKLVVVHFGPCAVQVVNSAVDQLFVAWDGRRRDDDVVSRTDVDLAMLPHGHAYERRRGLALAARAGDRHLLGWQAVHLMRAQQVLGT